MKSYSAIQCGVITNATILDLTVEAQSRYVYFNNPVALQSVTFSMLEDIATGETAALVVSRTTTAEAGEIVSLTLDDTCKQYDSIVLDVSDYGNSGGDAGDNYIVKVVTPATTVARCIVTFNYILIESGGPVWNNRVTGIKQKRNPVSGNTSVIRDATPFYTRAS